MKEFKTFEDMKHDIPEGATHYQDENDEFSFAWFNSKEGRCFVRGRWVECSMSDYPDGEIKPIPPKHTRTEYEKVTESIFDLRDEFERGELYCKFKHAREYTQITNAQTLAQALNGGCCYRLVEKEIDERQEFIEKCMEIAKQGGTINDKVWLGKIYDNGCRFVRDNREVE